jgi:hypothetical protein
MCPSPSANEADSDKVELLGKIVFGKELPFLKNALVKSSLF